MRDFLLYPLLVRKRITKTTDYKDSSYGLAKGGRQPSGRQELRDNPEFPLYFAQLHPVLDVSGLVPPRFAYFRSPDR
jgi:hypothetical protein